MDIDRVSVLQLWDHHTLLKAFGLLGDKNLADHVDELQQLNPQALSTVSPIGGCRCTATAASTSRPWFKR